MERRGRIYSLDGGGKKNVAPCLFENQLFYFIAWYWSSCLEISKNNDV